jgi:hypothetical protein
MQIRQWGRFLLKKRHPPPPCRFAWKFVVKLPKVYCSSNTYIRRAFVEILANYLELQTLLNKSTKFVLEFCGLDPVGILALVDFANLSCFNHELLRIHTWAPCPFRPNDCFRENFSVVFIKEKEFRNKVTRIYLTAIVFAHHHENWGCNSSLSRASSVGTPSWVGF